MVTVNHWCILCQIFYFQKTFITFFPQFRWSLFELSLFSANGWSECDEQGPRPGLQVLHLPLRAAGGEEERRHLRDQGFLFGNIQ